MTSIFRRLSLCSVLFVAWLAVAPVVTADGPIPEATFDRLAEPMNSSDRGVPAAGEIELILDDGTFEGVFGVTDGTAARQFLWFQQFDLGGESTFRLDRVEVLFPTTSTPGDAVELVVFHDTDLDPSSGTVALGSWTSTVQFVDGAAWSVYEPPSELDVPEGGQLLVGVVPRWIESGVTPEVLPAALDTSSPAGRSWVATWIGDPPAGAPLPSDQFLGLVDVLVAQSGNWAIRAVGVGRPAVEVPASSTLGLVLLAGLLAGVAGILLRRR